MPPDMHDAARTEGPPLTESQKMKAVEARLESGDERMDRIESELKQLGARIEDLVLLLETLNAIINTARGGLRVLEVLGKVAKPVAAIVGAYYAIKAGMSAGVVKP